MDMKFKMVMAYLLALAGVSLISVQAQAAQPTYPSKPIRIIVGFPPSGSADIFARLVGQKLSEAWNQPVVVDNRPGAGSTIGSQIAADAAPDGYTLMVVSASFATSAGLYKKLKYDPIKSFEPVTLISSTPNLLLAHPSVRAKSARELISMAKASPGKFTMGSAGTGSITHLSGVLFTSMAGIKVLSVPYKGGGPALNALIGGQIQLEFLSVPASQGQVKAGRVKALGVTSAKRSPVLPDVPTIAESGVPGYEARNWYGMLAPAGTPRAIVVKLNKEVVSILQDPKISRLIANRGAEAEGSTPEEFGRYVRSEIAKWSKVIKQAGLKQL
jgi:tripartite-type tricarboxylate transporter receptor subunit TctC